jgi:hypothetical protein
VVVTFRRHFDEVARISGKPEYPEYREVLDDARSWLDYYERHEKKELMRCFERELGTAAFELPQLRRKAIQERPPVRELESGILQGGK